MKQTSIIEEKIKDIVMTFVMEYPDADTRDKIGKDLRNVLGISKVTDVTGSTAVDMLVLVYILEYSSGEQTVLTISTANGWSDRDNIEIILK